MAIKQFQIIAAGGPVLWDLKKKWSTLGNKKTHKLSQSRLLGNPDTFSKADIVWDEVTRQEKQLLSLNIWLFSEQGLQEEVLTM